MGSSTIFISMRKFCPQSSYELVIFEIFLDGNKGLDLKGVHYNLILYGRDSANDKIRGVHGTPTEGELVCMWAGAGGEMGKSAYKINVSVYFSDYMPFFIRDAGKDP